MSDPRVCVVVNAKSGRGRAIKLALALHANLASHGVICDVIPLDRGADPLAIASAAGPKGVLVIAGGDGTIRSFAHAASVARAPIYHLASGNENLFAREFGHTSRAREAGAIIRQALQDQAGPPIEHPSTTWCDLANLTVDGSGQPRLHREVMTLMASIGPDASVIHRLHEQGRRAKGHLAYVLPVIDELQITRINRLSIWADGKPLVTNQRGMLIIANSQHYALRINPCHEARVRDGLLDVAFWPAETAADVAGWYLASRLRMTPGAIKAKAQSVRVSVIGEPAPVQVDGEASVMLRPGAMLEVSLAGDRLPVVAATAM